MYSTLCYDYMYYGGGLGGGGRGDNGGRGRGDDVGYEYRKGDFQI